MNSIAVLCAAAAAAVSASLFTSVGAAAAVPPPDRTAPARVTDLAVAASSYGAITLAWTAVGDDGGGAGACTGAGTARTYDVRYSATPPGGDLTAWFNAATPATGEPAPSACGSRQSFCLSTLAPSGTYYAALRVIDEAGNASPVSNVTTGGAGAMTGVMHISNVNVGFSNVGGPRRQPHGYVWVVDALWCVPVPCAAVTGAWSDCLSETGTGISDENGLAAIHGSRGVSCWGGGSACCFVFTVTTVSHAGFTYDAGANVESSSYVPCDFFGPCGGLASDPCRADFDRDGFLTGSDFDAFVAAFEAGDPAGDIDADGSVTGMDFDAFVRAFEEGC